MSHEIPARSGSGYLLLVVLLVLQVGSVAGVIFLPPLLKVLLALAAVVERWLFFAEAEHVVTLYYGRDKV